MKFFETEFTPMPPKMIMGMVSVVAIVILLIALASYKGALALDTGITLGFGMIGAAIMYGLGVSPHTSTSHIVPFTCGLIVTGILASQVQMMLGV